MVQVYDPPKANFQVQNTTCIGDTILLKDNSSTFGRSIISYSWSLHNNELSNADSCIVYADSVSVKKLSYRLITDVGCFVDTVKPLTIYNLPNANFSISDSCINTKVIFKDSSVFLLIRYCKNGFGIMEMGKKIHW